MTDDERAEELNRTIERAAITVTAGLVRLAQATSMAGVMASGKSLSAPSGRTPFEPAQIARTLWDEAVVKKEAT